MKAKRLASPIKAERLIRPGAASDAAMINGAPRDIAAADHPAPSFRQSSFRPTNHSSVLQYPGARKELSPIRGRRSAQLLEQCLGFLQDGCVEAFREPAVNGR